ncbi:mandelate racemase/muconate lactonizing enzyme family protein [Paramicrobacterium agarici]|uniref:mandelate racemase/muconate lactonizing enzyme family protein n=1 Tax=Paramicrobacterium agarici TaxID=630514 RepID=UPI001150ED7F|nr:mandelate racemase/muconate lactonizing enzyme family protein [Microbacterium agarici]TQO22897.1 L-alanine-DL-glutamate epimerase-like enolase superfamily enzyme [Microbacterium agarici]
MFEIDQLCDSVPHASVPDSAVADVRCRVYRAPITSGVAMSFGALGHRVMFLVDVEFDDGSVATGESWVNYPSWGWRERIATVTEGIAPLLVGRRFSDTAEVRDVLLSSLTRVARQWGAIGPVYQAISAIDQAFWVRAAQQRGVALSALLSDDPLTEIPVYGSSLGPSGVRESAERCLDLGLHAAKIKLGFGRETDEQNLAAARSILGDGFRLFGDANQGWTLEEAISMAPVLRDFGIEWIEEPVSGDDPEHLGRVFTETGIAIATGENLYGSEAFLPYLAQPGVSIVQPDAGKVGGVTDYQQVVAAAAASGTLVAPHLYNGAYSTAISIQLAAANPTTPWLEWDIRQNPVREPVDHLLTPNGTVAVPRGSGLGVDIDLEHLAPHLVPLSEEAQ